MSKQHIPESTRFDDFVGCKEIQACMAAVDAPSCINAVKRRTPLFAAQIIELGVHLLTLRHLQMKPEIKVRYKAHDGIGSARKALAVAEQIHQQITGTSLHGHARRTRFPSRDETIAELMTQWDHLKGALILQRRCTAFDETVTTMIAARCREVAIRLNWIIEDLTNLIAPLRKAVNE